MAKKPTKRPRAISQPAPRSARRLASPKPKPHSKPESRPATRPELARRVVPPRRSHASLQETQSCRELFWQNVLREVLVSLIMLRVPPKAPEPDAPPATNVLDGRLGLITHTGQRIPIAAVYPVFSASMAQSPRMMDLSTILQCTVFQVHTPGGEVYTLPLHEIRGFHALTEELMDELADSARARGAGGGPGEVEPFGFAAFTSLARARLPDDEDEDASPSGAD